MNQKSEESVSWWALRAVIIITVYFVLFVWLVKPLGVDPLP